MINNFFRNIWWKIRGVGPSDYRYLCARCYKTGQAHWSLKICWRYKRKEV